MDERRIFPRAACRLHCRIHRGKKRILARIVDVSEGGLCLYSPIRLDAKTMIEISIDVPGLSNATVTAQVWHVRQQKVKSSSRKIWVVGVMLSESDDAYLRLLATTGLTTLATPEASPEKPEPRLTRNPKLFTPRKKVPAPTPPETAHLDEIEPKVFRVRVQARTGPRTRLLTLTANSQADAREIAVRDLTAEWRIIEVLSA